MNWSALTIVVFALTPNRPSAASTRSSANRACPGSLVNGDHAVETSVSGGVWADMTTEQAASSSAPSHGRRCERQTGNHACAGTAESAGRGSREIVPSSPVEDVDQSSARNVWTTEVGAQAEFVPKKNIAPPAKAPRRFAVVDAQGIAECVDLRANHAEPRQGIRTEADALLAADWNADQQIACRRRHAVAPVRSQDGSLVAARDAPALLPPTRRNGTIRATKPAPQDAASVPAFR